MFDELYFKYFGSKKMYIFLLGLARTDLVRTMNRLEPRGQNRAPRTKNNILTLRTEPYQKKNAPNRTGSEPNFNNKEKEDQG